MASRRVATFLGIFALGALVGCMLVRWTGGQPIGAHEAQRRALQILDRRTPGAAIGANPIVDAVKRIEPAVVNIDTVGKIKAGEQTVGTVYVDQEVHGKGSGVIVTPDGYIVTNNHVVDGADRIRVTLANGQWHYASLVGVDPQTDLAVIRIGAADLPTAEFGNSDSVQVGEWSIAVGNPLGLGSTVTVGVISALNRRNLQVEEGHKLDGAIQTDAPINRGNSGGALANVNGQLIGINTAILSAGPGGGSIGLGFAIPVNTARRIVRDLIATGKTPVKVVRRPWLGIGFEAVPESLCASLGLPSYRGVLINRVVPQSPAFLAGIDPRDIVLDVDAKEIGDERDVREAIQPHQVGDKIDVRVVRAATHRIEEIAVTLKERPDDLYTH
ncbi:MAG TPA: trypsin-like peptidase domain-containing protein [Chthonomonadaceae bacterium]|nr:trypsin-like peptidase domain-containing protein [Chthonomonadaceae bacterium]